MVKPHKHAELIKKWADGAEIQYRECTDARWYNILSPSWSEAIEYRVKPEPVKTIGYRRYVFVFPESLDYPSHRVNVIWDSENCMSAEAISSRNGFIRWIDTDWQYEYV